MTNRANNPIQSVEKDKQRLHYLDHIKVALTVLVIAHHASQAYAPMSSSWLISNPTKSAVLMPFATVNAAFFMGLFFFVSGYFVPGAFDRKGSGAFLKTRFVRLGLPAIVIPVVVFAPVMYFIMNGGHSLAEFISNLYQSGWQLMYIHLWFLLHLLIYTLVYALWRMTTNRFTIQMLSDGKRPWHTVLLVFTIILVLFTWVVRFRYTINQWIPLFFLVPAEMAHLPQYISMFLMGILAYRFKALDRLPTAVGMVWLGIGMAAGAWYYMDILSGESLMVSLPISGKNLGSLVWSVWEALVCVGLGVGLLTLFREWINRQAGRLMAAITRSQYGAYIVHILVVVGVQAGLNSFSLAPFIKFGIVTVVAAIISFWISHLLVKIPGLKKVI
jgi:surface polysaccharide O-acyltransferase-like enzyme